jgi:hypothetical protein
MRSGQRRASILVLLLGGIVAVAGCGDASVTASASAGSAAPSGGASPSVVLPSQEPSAVPSETEAPTPASTESPSASATSAPTESPAASPSGGVAAGFSCAYPFRRTGTTSSVVQVDDVRVGTHATYDRVVFQFTGRRFPTLRLDAATPPFTMDPSDLPLTVPGRSFVLVRLVYASGEGGATADGKATYTGPDRFVPRYDRLASLVEAGDFEGHMSWVAGFTGTPCYRVTRLNGPARYVIDFQTP